MRPTGVVPAAVLLLCLAGVPHAQLPEAVEIPVISRVVQCDGFLMEWTEEQARALGGSRVVWDAVQTPDGVAGYVRAPQDAGCGLAEVIVVREDEIDSVNLLVAASGPSCCPFHAVQVDTVRGETVVEFVLPWQRLGSTARSGAYRLRLEAVDTTGLQCGLATFCGPRESFAAQVFTPALKRQVVVVAILLGLYLGLMLWVRKRRTRQTQSPHQSA